LALVVAGLISYALFYRIPAMLGMQTGYPPVRNRKLDIWQRKADTSCRAC